jgi:4-aminobutyrate aminotransferase
VARLNALLEKRLAAFSRRFEGVGDTRLIGALCGIELVRDRRTREKDVENAERILYECLGQGLSYKVSQGNVLTLAPPLIITEEELGRAMDIVESALERFLA